MSDDPIKDALKLIPYGFYSLTSRNNDEVNAMVVNWVTQASFSPRLLAVGLQKSSHTHALIGEGSVFALNIFRQEDKDRIMPYTKGRSKNPDKMVGAKYSEAPETGSPILDGAAAYLECKVVKLVDVGGDHDILVGEVVGAEVFKSGEPSDTLSLPGIGWSYAG